MNDLARLVDDYDGHLARKTRATETRRHYRFTLWKFVDTYGRDKDPSEITRQDCERFLNRWADKAPATLAARTAALAGFTSYLADLGVLADDPMRRVARPRRLPPEDLNVTTISTDDVQRLFAAVSTWPEAVALGLLAYTGARRHAASNLRWRDVDLAQGEARFHEKGGKTIVKPLPDDLVELLIAYTSEHLQLDPDSYVIPNLHANKVRRPERDDRVVWRIVQTIARRAGVRTHVHALRAAFAVYFLEEHGGTIDALKELLGHRRIETTYVYLRRVDKRRQMEQVRGLSWGGPVLPAKPLEAHTGFEPVSRAKAGVERSGGQPAGKALIENPHMRELIDRLREKEPERKR